MASAAPKGTDLYVFREAKRAVGSRALLAGLLEDLDALAAAACAETARSIAERALLRAGEIECLLVDHGSPRAHEAARLADRLAEIYLGAPSAPPRAPLDLVRDLPPTVRPSPPEGFAYYAVQPRRFAERARDLATAGAVAVIGIRTIGATLSAIVAAALRLAGVRAERTSVRPTGHPYARELCLAPETAAWIDAQRDEGARFVVVDEGPGMSGSSFLAAAEAIAERGVDPGRITLLGTRLADPRTLLAERAAERFARFGAWLAVALAAAPEDAAVDISAGTWRARFWADEARWPATWRSHERMKLVSADGRRLYKFEGLGRWGAAVRERAEAVADAGFGPRPEDAGGGFVRYPTIAGRPLARGDRSRAMLERLADYCAFRAAAFPAPDADPLELQTMADFDAEALSGQPLGATLVVERPVIADARLHPHEWIAAEDGRLVKVDAAAHGDDHVLPGPTDVAWDLAGAIVEWGLAGEARRAFLDRYTRASGDRPGARLPAYLAAYAVLHAARTRMAASAEPTEAPRLMREHARYLRRWQSG
jgi:adenine/guanine phosphoribosyltransferase-like PRPP-binding protein